jgi:hypothetical protein
MGLLDLHLDKVPDQKPVTGGEEYKLTIKTCEQKDSSGGKPMLAIMFTINDHPDAPPVFQNFMLPEKEDDKAIKFMKLRRIKDLVIALGRDPAEAIQLDDLPGEGLWAILKEDSDATYGDRNIIGKFINQA